MRTRFLNVEVKLSVQCSAWFRGLPIGEAKAKVDAMLDTLKERPDAGDHVRRSLWPRSLSYQGINNLWRFDIDGKMRATYTIKREGDKFLVLIIEIFADHKSYEKRFGY